MLLNGSEYGTDNCSLMRTLEIVGERWTLLVLREALLGRRRFDDFQRSIGCARNVLATRLATLVEHGILRREPYREPGSRRRDEYRLTEKGRALSTALAALTQWGDRYLADPAGAPIEVVHRECGDPVRAILACARHGELRIRDLALKAGPGAKRIA
jgi:DNA-binding HxlR family transcriptional regulator